MASLAARGWIRQQEFDLPTSPVCLSRSACVCCRRRCSHVDSAPDYLSVIADCTTFVGTRPRGSRQGKSCRPSRARRDILRPRHRARVHQRGGFQRRRSIHPRPNPERQLRLDRRPPQQPHRHRKRADCVQHPVRCRLEGLPRQPYRSPGTCPSPCASIELLP